MDDFFSDALSDEVFNASSDLIEAGLDSVLEDGLLKEIPVISSAVSICKIGDKIRRKTYLKKLSSFVIAFNHGIKDSGKEEYYKSRIVNKSDKNLEKELEYICILIDRYVDYDKPQKMANLYIAFLDGIITWNVFTKSAEALDRLLPGDYQELLKKEWENIEDNNVSDSLLRLTSIGFVIGSSKNPYDKSGNGNLVFPSLTMKDYKLTEFGKTFLSICENRMKMH